MAIQIRSVNTGALEKLSDDDGPYDTGIFKKPRADRVDLDELGLAGDNVCDTKVHGGPDQAVYLYRVEDYEWWSSELGRDIQAGTFGDNLTISGLESPALNVGDKLVFPDLVLQVTAPRIPCSTLANRMEDKTFAKKFMQADRPGMYCRVLQAGTVGAGDVGTIERYAGTTVSIVTFFHDYHRKLSIAELDRYLEIPIDIRSREYLAGERAKAGVAS